MSAARRTAPCRSSSASAARSVAAGPLAGGATAVSRRPSTPTVVWTAAVTRLSGWREGTRGAGARDAIIGRPDASLQIGSTLVTCPYEVFGNHKVGRGNWAAAGITAAVEGYLPEVW